MNDWPGRRRAESSRQWSAIAETARRAAEIDALEGLILLGSFARGDPDELSDVDLLAVASTGRFAEVWALRHHLAGDPVVTWESRSGPEPRILWLTWLTRELVKVECGIVDPASGGKELAEPFAVLLGDASLADRFPRIARGTVEALAAQRRRDQLVFDPDELTAGERIDWKLSELKHAVRDALRG